MVPVGWYKRRMQNGEIVTDVELGSLGLTAEEILLILTAMACTQGL